MQFNILKRSILETGRSTPSFFKNVFIIILCVSLPFGLFEQFIFQMATQIEDKTSFGLLGILASGIEIFLVQVALGYGIKRMSPYSRTISEHYKAYLKDVTVETLRSYGRIAIGFLLLILPGIYRYIQYSLINYIVQFDERYARGEIDALETSRSLLKGRFFPFAISFVLTQSVIIGIQFYGVRFILSTDPISWFLNFIVEISVSAFVYLYFFNYYKNLIQTEKLKEV